ncbi:MAG: response regulator [Nitrospirae bacterium]|nr:response regulator [Nitrospirota bacterium]
MRTASKPLTVLMADDDPEDCLLTLEAWDECGVGNSLQFVQDGTELMDYLYHRGTYTDPATSPRPDLIILDLKMPKKDGHTVLKEIKADPQLKGIPIVVFTTSQSDEDTSRTFNFGANAALTKPDSIRGYRAVMQALNNYWSSIAILPHKRMGEGLTPFLNSGTAHC